MSLLPAHQITTFKGTDEESGKKVERPFTGKDYLDKFNFLRNLRLTAHGGRDDS